MPLWIFAHSPNTFSAEEKQGLAREITRMYTRLQIPAFFVNVRFSEMDPSTMYIGGESHLNYTAISIYHIAAQFKEESGRKRFLDKVDSILTPRLREKGMDWEYFVQETPIDLWRINGTIPPEFGSELWKQWVQQNRPVEGDLCKDHSKGLVT